MSGKLATMTHIIDILTPEFIKGLFKKHNFKQEYNLYIELKNAIANVQLDNNQYKTFPKLADSKKRLKNLHKACRKLHEELEDLPLDLKANQAIIHASTINETERLNDDAIQICTQLGIVARLAEAKLLLDSDPGGNNPYPWRNSFIGSLCLIYRDGTEKPVHLKQDRLNERDYGELFIFIKDVLNFVCTSEIITLDKPFSNDAIKKAILENKVYQALKKETFRVDT